MIVKKEHMKARIDKKEVPWSKEQYKEVEFIEVQLVKTGHYERIKQIDGRRRRKQRKTR